VADLEGDASSPPPTQDISYFVYIQCGPKVGIHSINWSYSKMYLNTYFSYVNICKQLFD